MIEDQNLVENKVYLAFDKEVWEALAHINTMRSKESKILYKPEVYNMSQYYKRLLNHIVFYGDIVPILLESVYDDIKTDSDTMEFVKEFAYYVDKSNFHPKNAYDKMRNYLAKKYCEPFKYKMEEFEAPFEIKNGMPEKKAYVVADATLSNCQLVVANPLQYISKENEKAKNERNLGIMQANFENGYFYYYRNNEKVTIRPLAIATIGPMTREEEFRFSAPKPKYLTNKNKYDDDVMCR